MGRERMPNPVMYQKKEKPKETLLSFSPCIVCDTPINDGYYSRHEDKGTCSKTCMKIQDAKEKYPDHPLSSFLKRFNL